MVAMVVYFVVVSEMSWIAGVKKTGSIIATVVAHTPETIIVTKEFLVTNDKEYRVELAKTDKEYTQEFKKVFRQERKASKKFWKDTREDFATRTAKADIEMAALNALDAAEETTTV